MAVEHSEALAVAEEIKLVAEKAKALFWEAKEVLRHNSALAIDWGGQEKPAFLNEDVDGNIDGVTFTRQELSNAVGSLDNLCKLLDNGQQVSTGDHLGNLEKLCRPNV